MIIYRQIRLRIIEICVICIHDTTFRVIRFSVICNRDIIYWVIRFCAIRIRGIVKKNIRILIRSRIRDISLRGIRFCAIRIVKKNIRIELSLICYRWIGLCLIGSSGIKNSFITRFCKYLWCCYFIYSYLFHTI